MRPALKLCLVSIAWIAALGAILTRSPSSNERTGDPKDQRLHKAIEASVGFLAVETPKWRREHKCFSCHNNGDAARALLKAKQLGFAVPDASLADTIDWLANPKRWEEKPKARGGDGGSESGSKDLSLARLQFSLALELAIKTETIADRSVLDSAALKLALDQTADGSWKISDNGVVAAPATYGPVLSTLLASRVLASAGANEHAEAVAKARAWLDSRKIQNVQDAAVVVWSLAVEEAGNGQKATKNPRFSQALDLLKARREKTAAGDLLSILPASPTTPRLFSWL